MVICFCTDQYRLPGSPPEHFPHFLSQKERILSMEQFDFNGSVKAVTWNPPPQTKEETLERLRQSPVLYNGYRKLNERWKELFLDFCQGKKSLPLTYDPFFKYLFDPEIHGKRLSRFVSSLLGFEVKILQALPSEDRLIDGESYLIMDLLARLTDGSLVNIEVQKQGYAFPAERISCYSADLLMRQYMRVRGNAERKSFSYKDIKKVYVIVLFEKSTSLFHQFPGIYLHHGKTVFDSGLNMELLQEYYLVALDVFQKIPYPEGEKSEQRAWLSLLTTENLEDAERLIEDYPWLKEIYQEIAMLRRKPEEVLGMWSEALRMLDENTLKYYVEELEEKLQQVTKEKDEELRKTLRENREKDAEIAALKKQLEELSKK